MSRGQKKRGDVINGVLLLDKPAGMTSNKALQKCRYKINAQKAGHTGALDPLATGLLPLCFGQATKVSSFLLGKGKTYAVSIMLGETRDTGDADGKVLEQRAFTADEDEVKAALNKYIGEYDQVPPMYSALKVNGQPLYKLARQGIEIERKARRVSAHDIRFISLEGACLSFEVDCSSGFYVRSLSEDIGETLGCGAHVKTLRRLSIGSLSLENAITWPDFEALEPQQACIDQLLTADSLIDDFTQIKVDATQKAALIYGQAITLETTIDTPTEWLRMYDEDQGFIGLGQLNSKGLLAPKRLFI